MVSFSMRKCSCGREIDPYALSASFFEEDYCSEYCRVFDQKGLKIVNGEEKYGKAQFKGFNWWPVIEINCEMCEKSTELRYDWENANRQFCSRACFNKMKMVKKRRSQMHYAALRLLRHRHRHCVDGWISAATMCEIMNRRRDFTGNPRRWGNMMTKWVKRGIVESRSEHPREYRLKNEYLNVPLAKLFYECEARIRVK